MADSVVIDLQRACDLACGFCPVRAADAGPSAQRGERAALAARAALAQGASEVVLTGGEPTLEPWLPALVAGLRKGGAQVVLETHGALAPALVERLGRAGLGRAVVACNSLDPKVVDGIAGRPGTWLKLRAGVRALLDAGIAVDLTAVVLPENATVINDLRRRAAQVWPASRASLGRLWLRPLRVRADRGPLLTLPHLAAVLQQLALQPGMAVGCAPGFELPACAYPDPGAAADLLRLSPTLVARESERYRRLPACATCPAATQCPGALPEYALQLQTVAPLLQMPAAAGIDTLSDLDLEPRAALQLAAAHQLDPLTQAQCRPDPPPPPPPPAWQAPDRAVFDREAWEVLQGWRQVLRREVGSAAAAQQVALALQSAGLCAQVSGGQPGHTLAAPSWVVWGGLDSSELKKACSLDVRLAEALRQGRAAAAGALIADLGRCLGYPDCCIQAFGAAADSGDARLVQSLARRQDRRLLPEQNWAVVPLRWMSHLPCTPDCAATAQRTAAVRLHVQARHPAWAEHALAALSSPVVAWSYERFAVFAGGQLAEPGLLTYQQVVGLDQFADAHSLLQRRSWRMFASEILAKLRLGDNLRLRGPLWQVRRGTAEVAELRFEGAGPALLRFDADQPA